MEEEKIEASVENQTVARENVEEQSTQIVQSAEISQQSAAAAVAQEVEYAGFWERFAAMFVDGLILIIPSAIINAIFGKYFGNFLGYILAWSYAIYMLNDRQATFGKMALGLKVTTADGGKPIVGKLALREIVGKFLNIVTLFVGYIMIVFTAKKQGLHDMIADTVVVYDPARKRRPWLVWVGIIPVVILLLLLFLVIYQATHSFIGGTSRSF